MSRICGYILVFLMFASTLSKAQFYNGLNQDFGKNRVQFQDYFWNFYSYKKFNTYFYTEGQEIADYTSVVVDTVLKEFELFFDVILEEKFDVIVYNSHGQFLQSNLGDISNESANVGGMTRIIGNKLFVYYNGNRSEFYHQIRAGIAQIMVDRIYYGSNFKEIAKNKALITLPEWYYLGLVSYLTDEWNSEIEESIKEGFLNKRYKNFNALSSDEAKVAGHGLWKFIADKYGKEIVKNLVFMTKIGRGVDNGFMFVLGKIETNLINDWKNSFKEKLRAEKSRESIEDAESILKKVYKKRKYSEVKLSKDGGKIAYVTNELGQSKVYIEDLKSKKRDRVLKHGHKIDVYPDATYPVLTWHPNGKFLTIIFERRGEIWWWLYDLESGDITKSQIFYLEKVLSASYSPDGKKFIFSAVLKGKTDLFLFDIQSRTQKRITNDYFDDLHPSFTIDGKSIVFSSNRDNDSLAVGGKLNIINGFETDIFLYKISDLPTDKTVLKSITNSYFSSESHPFEISKDRFVLLSDNNGIVNQFSAKVDSSITHVDTIPHYRFHTSIKQLSNYDRNIRYQFASTKTKQVFWLQHHESRDVIQSASFESLLGRTFQTEAKIEEEKKNVRKDSVVDNSATVVDFNYDNWLKESFEEKWGNDSSLININRYVFEEEKSENQVEEIRIDIGESVHLKPKTPTRKKKRGKVKFQAYETAFQVDYVVGQLDNNFVNPTYQRFTGGPIFSMPGLSPFMKFGTSDLLEDYKVVGGIRFTGVRNNEVFVSFENLKERIDKQFVFYRRSDFFRSDFDYKSVSYQGTYKMSYPFNMVSRIKGGVTGRFDDLIVLSEEFTSLSTKDVKTTWAGLNAEYVFDITRTLDVNILSGIRTKVFAEYYQQMVNWDKNTIVVGADCRDYFPIYKKLILATRIAGSTSFGTQKLLYYMGGVDGWLLPKFNQNLEIAELQNGQEYVFQALATNMRGFTQNVRNGTSFVTANAELRWPIVKHFYNSPIRSAFIRNFQVLGFFDVGTAWSGASPFSDENSLNNETIIIGDEARIGVINLKSQRDPIVAGYGFGLRSTLWGYFIRADWAWGIEDGTVLDKQFYISLSLDF